MISDSQSLRQELAAFSLVEACDLQPDGSFRIATPLRYPDGSPVAVFYHGNVDLFASARLTDQGRTAALLADSQVYIEGYEKRQQILADICRTLHVQDAHGQLGVTVESGHSLADAVMRLAQACVRVADLSYTQSFRAQSDFRHVFADFLNHERQDNIADYTIEGRFGRRIKVDFYTHQHSGVDNLAITMFSANETSSHPVANDVFCRWYDLERYRDKYRFVTVVDSTSKAFRLADVNRVGSVSRVLSYPAEAEALRTLFSIDAR